MFGFKRDKQKETNTTNAKLAKKLLGKDSGRRVFGFACSPDIQAQLKLQAGQLNVPLFALVEHCLQLSSGLIARVADDPEECELLRRHIIEDHVGRRTIEKISRYDEEMGDLLEEEKRRRFQIEKAVHQVVVHFARKGMKPSTIGWYIDYGYRCFVAVTNGRPVPKPQEESFQFRRKSQPPDNQPAEGQEDRPNDEFSKQPG